MTIVVRADPSSTVSCCVCGERLTEEGAQAFVFVPGEDDPVVAHGHADCVCRVLGIEPRAERRHGAA
jgi:hypothetical protein